MTALLGAQGAVEARYNNYVTIVKNLTFSKLPWYDLQVSADEDAEQPHKQASRLLLEEAGPGDSNSDNETPSEAADADMLQVSSTCLGATLCRVHCKRDTMCQHK